MKRITALLLTLLLVTMLAVPVMAEGGAPTAAEPEKTLEPETTEEAPEVLPEEETVLPEEMAKTAEIPAAAETLEAASIQNAANTAQSVRFEDLRKLLMKYNWNVAAINAALGDLDDVSTDQLEGAVDQLEKLSGTVQQTLGRVQMASMTEGLTEEQQLIYGALAVTLGADLASLQSQTASLESQIESLDSTIESNENTLVGSINQIVKGAETLYVGIITMEAAMGDIDRGLAALDRAVAIVEKQAEMGMAAPYDVETMHYQRATVQSQKESLEFQIRTSKITLEAMLGMELSGTVHLADLTMPTAEELEAIDFEADLKQGLKQNVDVMNAELGAESDSGEISWEAAKDTFTYNFKVVCLTVPEKQRLVKAAEDAVAYQQRTFEIAAKKYELGMLSHEEYLTAEGDLKSAESGLFSAQLELFTAYRNYVWGKTYGIV